MQECINMPIYISEDNGYSKINYGENNIKIDINNTITEAANGKVKCEVCNKEMQRTSAPAHLKSAAHITNVQLKANVKK